MRARPVAVLLSTTVLALLAACGTGPVRRVSEPAAQIQQLTVRADGGWDVQLRLQNYSSIPMRFDSVRLALTTAGQPAGDLHATPALTVGPESADVIDTRLQPSAAAKLALAEALAGRRSVAYSITGTIAATPDQGGQRTFTVRRDSELSPAPGLPGVLR